MRLPAPTAVRSTGTLDEQAAEGDGADTTSGISTVPEVSRSFVNFENIFIAGSVSESNALRGKRTEQCTCRFRYSRIRQLADVLFDIRGRRKTHIAFRGNLNRLPRSRVTAFACRPRFDLKITETMQSDVFAPLQTAGNTFKRCFNSQSRLFFAETALSGHIVRQFRFVHCIFMFSETHFGINNLYLPFPELSSL